MFFQSNEAGVINQFFNIDDNGDIISAKGGYNYALGIVLKDNDIDYYIFKLDVILENETTIATLFDYSGQVKIYRKSLESTNLTYINGTGSNKITLESNELFNNKAYNNQEDEEYIASFISNNILSDYADGIKTCTLQIMCQDMYSTTGEKIKDWSKGEILEVGDLVRVDKDNNGNSQYTYSDGNPIIFRVTGSKFSYNGSPKLDLELQEVKQTV